MIYAVTEIMIKEVLYNKITKVKYVNLPMKKSEHIKPGDYVKIIPLENEGT